MPAIRQIAEAAWRINNPNPSTDAATKLPEYILMAIGALAWICKLNYFQENTEGERIVQPCWLTVGEGEAEQDKYGVWTLCLPKSPVSFPNDIGVYRVAPNTGYAAPYVKVTEGLNDLCDGLRERYFRRENKLIFPDGLINGVKKISYQYVVMPDLTCVDDELVPEDYRLTVIQETLKMFREGKGSAEDKTNDGKDNTRP
jgi:hypothetical protein